MKSMDKEGSDTPNMNKTTLILTVMPLIYFFSTFSAV